MIARTIEELNAAWAKMVYPFTKPLFEPNQKGVPEPIGSSVLVSHGATEYLLSATHVIAPHITAQSQDEVPGGALYSYLPEQVKISGIIHSLPDPYDICLIEIPQGARDCLLLPDYVAPDVNVGEMCLLFGFPARDKNWKIDSPQLRWQAAPLSYLGTVYRKYDTSFTIRLSQKHVNRDGKRLQRLGKLNGISGGGAFVLRNDRPRLAGTIIEYHKNRSEIVCTYSRFAVALIQ
jgi:hypothetical protein